MRIDVALLPGEIEQPAERVCIVIDALRATSTLAVLFGRGVARVLVSGTIEAARTLKEAVPAALLCGEARGLPPAGFDHGNSPVEFAALPLTGREVILATSNGTRALTALAGARAVFTGSLLNLNACMRAAVYVASTEIADITVVCAGNHLGTRFSLEDTAVAGAFVAALREERPDATLGDGAVTALRLWRSYATPGEPFAEAEHGRLLVEIGLGADIDACAQIDRYAVAPRLHIEAGRLVLLDAPAAGLVNPSRSVP